MDLEETTCLLVIYQYTCPLAMRLCIALNQEKYQVVKQVNDVAFIPVSNSNLVELQSHLHQNKNATVKTQNADKVKLPEN